MCLNCGCGEMHENHGQPLNLTYSRIALIASRNGITPLAVAENILGTVLGEITKLKPREDDDIVTFKLRRVHAHGDVGGSPRPPKSTGRYLSRSTEAGRERKAERQDQSDSADDGGGGT